MISLSFASASDIANFDIILGLEERFDSSLASSKSSSMMDLEFSNSKVDWSVWSAPNDQSPEFMKLLFDGPIRGSSYEKY